jgi:hypothetical protein
VPPPRPAAAPRWLAGTPPLIEDEFGAANKPVKLRPSQYRLS